jgi:hypothetical protein
MMLCRRLSLTSILSLVTLCTISAGPPRSKSAGSIELTSLTPEAGSTVDRSSVITAQLRFAIDNFRKNQDRYQISVKFQSIESRAVTFSKGPEDVVMLGDRSGSITMVYPLHRVWDDPKLRKPIVMYFYLHERTGKRDTVVLDKTEEIRFAVRESEPPA